MSFQFKHLNLKDVLLITQQVHTDERGFFKEIFRSSCFKAFGIKSEFTQDNFSKSERGTIRGLHYQKLPAAQAKLVCCLSGMIFDVAADIRRNSPSYGKWTGVMLDAALHNAVFIPEGFAPGFAVLSETAEVFYKTSGEYSPAHDAGIRWDDPDIAITWNVAKPIISKKDLQLPLLKNADNNFL